MLKYLMAFLMMVMMSATAWPAQTPPASAGLAHRHSLFDYTVAWKISQTRDTAVVEGTLKNTRYPYISDVDLRVVLLDAGGAVRAAGTDLPIPQHSRMDELVPFSVSLKGVKPEPGDQVEFQIHYRASDGQDEGIDWRSSFRADAGTGEVTK